MKCIGISKYSGNVDIFIIIINLHMNLILISEQIIKRACRLMSAGCYIEFF